MAYTMYTPLNVWLDPASVTDVVAYIQTYLSENTIYSETEIETIIHDYLIAHPELIGGVQSVNGKTGTVVLSASDINTENNVTIESVLTSLSSQISSIAASVATNTANITSLTGRVSTAETDISNLKSNFDENESEVKKIPEGSLSISTALATNATYDSTTQTLTIPANKVCAGASIRYRYTAQADDMNKLIRFIVSINQTVVNPNYIRPIVMWNYVDVSNADYVSVTQDGNTYTFDITVPNDRKNLDVGIFYLYGGTVGSDQTIQLTGIDYFYPDSFDIKYVFDSNFKGAKLAPFGDSYTSQGKWQPYVKSFLGLGTISGWAQHGGTLTSVYEQISTIPTDANIVTVWIGTNDYSNNRKVGSLLDDVSDETIKDAWGYTTFCAAMNYVCNWLGNNMKGKTIVFITPTQRFDSVVPAFEAANGKNAKGEVINNAGFALEDYANAMIEVANYWGYPVCDMYHESGINKNSYPAYYQVDALHPSQDGAKLLAQKIAAFINMQI